MEKIEMSQEQLVGIYSDGNAKTKARIREMLGENLSEILPIKERIKTFEDAVAELGEEHYLVKTYNSLRYSYIDQRGPNHDLLAYAMLRIITTALNEGWEPAFTENERRWYPWFELFTKEEIDNMSDEEKEKRGLLLVGGYASDGSRCGLASAGSNHAWSVSNASIGSRLAFKSEDLAEYAGKQFIKIYSAFCFLPIAKEE